MFLKVREYKKKTECHDITILFWSFESIIKNWKPTHKKISDFSKWITRKQAP